MADPRLRQSAADALLMHARTLAEPRWTPLPHQVPPKPTPYGWAMIAGRGAGKTDACAHYIAEHVKGPPCLPGPVPHWIGIIAPTLGDAATSCYAGPSGLRVHSPEAKMMTVKGGTVIRWPNGSEAKLFGAHSPEDVERLRSGGNRCAVWCVSEGTPVQTERGEVPIEQVRQGDRVWTRDGLRRVKAAELTRRNAETLVIRTEDGHRLELTPDHRVWVEEDGWVEAQNVTPGSRMVAWKNSSQGHLHGTNGTASGGAGPKPVTTKTTTETCCTASYGRRTSGRWTTTPCSTTGITTRRTTTSATFNQSPGQNTAQSTRRSTSTSTGDACRPAKVDGNEPVGCGTVGNPGTSVAHSAERSFSRQACAPSSAEAPAVHATVVRSVERSLTRPDTYDLEIDGEPEFFAGGLLIHNCEELAAWRHLDDIWDQMRFGLRVGPRPHWVASTTPKPRALIKKLVAGEVPDVVVTRGTTYDNPHLPQDIRNALEDAYGSTQIGRQELYADVIDQDENALWTREMIDAHRVRPTDVPPLLKTSVGVDPSGGQGEQGIVVVGKAMQEHLRADGRPAQLAHGYVLADRTCRLSPDGWGRRAVQAAVDHDADDICVETNFGGDMAVNTIRAAADAMGVRIPIRTVRATRGKVVRAEPVSALSEQGRWHMAGSFPELEDQLCTWYPDLDWSPDRYDAMVWPAHHLRIVKATMTGTASSKGLATAARTIG